MSRNRRGLHVVKPNHAEDDKATGGVSVKQLMMVGAITALTGTVVGAVAMEIYRYLRPKIPIPQPQPASTPLANPMMPWMLQQQPHPSSFPPIPFPYQPYVQPNPYVPQYALPPAPPAMAAPAPAIPALQSQSEPLSRTQLAQWQRGLEGWQRELEQGRDTDDRRD